MSTKKRKEAPVLTVKQMVGRGVVTPLSILEKKNKLKKKESAYNGS